MILFKLTFREDKLIVFMFTIFVLSTIQYSNFAFSKTECIEQDSLKLKVTTKIDELKIVVNDLNQLIECPTPENFSSDELQNWYEQTAVIMGIRNVIEIYILNFRKMLDEWNYLSHQPIEGDFIQLKMELKSSLIGLTNHIKDSKKLKPLAKEFEEKIEKAFTIIESIDK